MSKTVFENNEQYAISRPIQERKVGRKGVKPNSCYGLQPGSDLKHNIDKRTIFLVRGIGRVNVVAVLSRDKTDVLRRWGSK